MYIEANEFYGLKKFFSEAGYYETDAHRRAYSDIKALSQTGGIFALIGSVGSGKTTLLNKIQQDLEKAGNIAISRSLSVEKKALKITTLYVALFCDLSPKTKNNNGIKIPTAQEQRDRALIDLMKKQNKPTVLIIDEAHDIHGLTLISMKRLIENVKSKGATLSIILAGHPKLGNALASPAMEEIGTRAKPFYIDQAIDNKEKYITWLFNQCLQEKKKPQDVITPEAIQKLAETYETPLQIQHYLTKALQLGHQLGESIISAELVEQVRRHDLNSIEAQLSRKGYHLRATCELLNATPKEIQALFNDKANSPRKGEFMTKLRQVGINI